MTDKKTALEPIGPGEVQIWNRRSPLLELIKLEAPKNAEPTNDARQEPLAAIELPDDTFSLLLDAATQSLPNNCFSVYEREANELFYNRMIIGSTTFIRAKKE